MQLAQKKNDDIHLPSKIHIAQNIDGYAFSQEEGGAVTQTDVIRAYDTNLPKPDGK